MMIHTYDALIITLSVQTAPPRFPRSGPGCPAEADVLPPSSHSVLLQRRSRRQRVYQRCRRHVNQERNRRRVNRRSRRYVNLRNRGHVNCNKVPNNHTHGQDSKTTVWKFGRQSWTYQPSLSKNPFWCDQVIPHTRFILEEPFERKTYN